MPPLCTSVFLDTDNDFFFYFEVISHQHVVTLIQSAFCWVNLRHTKSETKITSIRFINLIQYAWKELGLFTTHMGGKFKKNQSWHWWISALSLKIGLHYWDLCIMSLGFASTSVVCDQINNMDKVIHSPTLHTHSPITANQNDRVLVRVIQSLLNSVTV